MAKRGRTQALAAAKKKKLEGIADVIMFAVFNGDEAAAAKFGITRRTIQRYRKRSEAEPELSQIVAYKLSQMEGVSLPDEMERTISDSLAAVRVAAGKLDGSAESISAFAELLKVVLGYDLNRKMLHARLGILNGVGDNGNG